jgi:hypothetical protein
MRHQDGGAVEENYLMYLQQGVAMLSSVLNSDVAIEVNMMSGTRSRLKFTSQTRGFFLVI